MTPEADIDVVARAYLSSIAGSRVTVSEADMYSATRVLAASLGSSWNEDVADAIRNITGSWENAMYSGVKGLILGGGREAWLLLKRIVQLSPMDRNVLGTIGAGLFEDWVAEERLVSVEPELCALIANDPRWRIVLEASWDTPPTLTRLLADSIAPERS